MTPEHAAVFQELRERCYKGGIECVEFSTAYYGNSREPRFGVRIHRNGWDHSIYAKTVPEVLARLEAYIVEREGM
jgi:hypothetical protein